MARLQIVQDLPAAEVLPALVRGWEVHPAGCEVEGEATKLAVAYRGEQHYYRLQPATGEDGSRLYFVSALRGGPLPEWVGILDSEGFRMPRGTPRSLAADLFAAYWQFWSASAGPAPEAA